MSYDRRTDVAAFIGECNAGILQDKLALALSDAALSQINYGAGNKKAKVAIEFSFAQMGENQQVIVSAKVAISNPTKRGKKSEEDITDTAFFVGRGGKLSINPQAVDDNDQQAFPQMDPEKPEKEHSKLVQFKDF